MKNKSHQPKNYSFLASKRDQEIFFEAIMNPPQPNAALKAAAKKFKNKWG